jgi:hypothetical protein
MRWLIILIGCLILLSCTERPEITTLEGIYHPGVPGYWGGGGGEDLQHYYYPPIPPYIEVNVYVSDDCWLDLYCKDINLNVVWKLREHTQNGEWHTVSPGDIGTAFVTVTLDGGNTETVEVISY